MSAESMPDDPTTAARVARRTLLAGAAAAVAGAWIWHELPSASATQRATTHSRATTTARPLATLPTPKPWLPGAGEVDPSVKLRAVQFLEALGTWSSGGVGVSAAQHRVAGLGYDPNLVSQARSLLASAPAAVTRVTDAQYGGILSSSSSVLVVLEQWLRRADGSVLHRGTTVDVRLVGARPKWRVTELHPANPGPRATVSAQARAVLNNHRIILPFAARADIESGHVHNSVLSCLTTLAHDYVLNVSVVRSGHPIYVFGTSRLSDHPRGRAVDIWSVDGHPIVHPQNRALTIAVMRRAALSGPYQVGGPVLLSGPRASFFSDQTHQDHIHLGFST